MNYLIFFSILLPFFANLMAFKIFVLPPPTEPNPVRIWADMFFSDMEINSGNLSAVRYFSLTFPSYNRSQFDALLAEQCYYEGPDSLPDPEYYICNRLYLGNFDKSQAPERLLAIMERFDNITSQASFDLSEAEHCFGRYNSSGLKWPDTFPAYLRYYSPVCAIEILESFEGSHANISHGAVDFPYTRNLTNRVGNMFAYNRYPYTAERAVYYHNTTPPFVTYVPTDSLPISRRQIFQLYAFDYRLWVEQCRRETNYTEDECNANRPQLTPFMSLGARIKAARLDGIYAKDYIPAMANETYTDGDDIPAELWDSWMGPNQTEAFDLKPTWNMTYRFRTWNRTRNYTAEDEEALKVQLAQRIVPPS